MEAEGGKLIKRNGCCEKKNHDQKIKARGETRGN